MPKSYTAHGRSGLRESPPPDLPQDLLEPGGRDATGDVQDDGQGFAGLFSAGKSSVSPH